MVKLLELFHQLKYIDKQYRLSKEIQLFHYINMPMGARSARVLRVFIVNKLIKNTLSILMCDLFVDRYHLVGYSDNFQIPKLAVFMKQNFKSSKIRIVQKTNVRDSSYLQDGYCYVAGICAADMATNPDNPWFICHTNSRYSWTQRK